MSEIAPATVHIQQFLEASASEIYDAWTVPGLIKQWLFVGDNSKITEVRADVQPGGSFSIIELTDDGETIDHFGTYKNADPPLALSFTLVVPKHFCGITHIDILIKPNGSGCEMTFHQTGVPPDVVEDSWKMMFKNLQKLVSAGNL